VVTQNSRLLRRSVLSGDRMAFGFGYPHCSVPDARCQVSPGFLAKTVTAHVKSSRSLNRFRILHGRQSVGRSLAEASDADAARQSSLNCSLHEAGREERECEIFLGGGNLTNSSPGRNRSGSSLGTPACGFNAT
jgi:hypothetical protein